MYSTVSWTDQTCAQYNLLKQNNCFYSFVSWTEQTCPQYFFLNWTTLPTVLFSELNKPVYNVVSWSGFICLHYCFLNWTNLSTVLFPQLIKPVYSTVSLTDQTCLYYPVCLKMKPVLQYPAHCLNVLNLTLVLFPELMKPVYSTVFLNWSNLCTVLFAERSHVLQNRWTDETCLHFRCLNFLNLTPVLFPELIEPVYSGVCWRIKPVWANMSTILLPELYNLSTALFLVLNKPVYSTVSWAEKPLYIQFFWTERTCLQYCVLNWWSLYVVLFPELNNSYSSTAVYSQI